MISVIIPVYNIESYLKDCIESILAQTYKEFEVVLVDDCSTDNSGAICDYYSQTDERVKCIHLPVNKGAAGARNTGIEQAKGEMITFIDSDDIIANTYLEILYNALNENDADISICSLRMFKGEKPKIKNVESREAFLLTPIEAIEKLYRVNEAITPHPVCKLFRKKCLINLKFPETVRMHEDQFFVPRALYNADKIVLIDAPLYMYRQVETSIMHQSFAKKNFSILDIMNANREFFASKKEDTIVKLVEARKALHQYTCVVLAKKNKVQVPKEHNISEYKALINMLKAVENDGYICYYVSKSRPCFAKILSYILKGMRVCKLRK